MTGKNQLMKITGFGGNDLVDSICKLNVWHCVYNDDKIQTMTSECELKFNENDLMVHATRMFDISQQWGTSNEEDRCIHDANNLMV